jgi:branched-chain amino acid transport system substrate-binding protein
MRISKSTASAAALALAACVFASCSSSSKSSSGSTATTTAGSAAGATASTAAAPKGAPIVVNMNVGLTGPITFPEDKYAALAAEDAINAAGGVKGRPLQVTFCDGQSPTDPNPSIQCTKSAISNSNVVAEVGDYSSFGDEITPLMHTAGLTDIAPVPIYASQMALSNSFPLMSTEAGLGACLIDNGAKSAAIAYIDIPGSSQQITFGNIFLKPRGTSYAKAVPISLTVTDPTPQVTALSSYGGVALGLAPTQVAQFVKAHASVAPSQPMCDAYLSASVPSTLQSLGSLANGMLIESGLPIITGDNPGVAVFKKQMAMYEPSAALDESALNSWLAVTAFAQVANQSSGDITRASVLSDWQNLTTLQVDGLLPPGLNLKSNPLGSAAVSQLSNHWMSYGKVENEQVQQVSSGFVDMLSAPSSSGSSSS